MKIETSFRLCSKTFIIILCMVLQGSLETVEVKIKKVFDSFGLSKDNFVIFAVLLGNHILSEKDLVDFFTALGVDTDSKVRRVRLSKFILLFQFFLV